MNEGGFTRDEHGTRDITSSRIVVQSLNDRTFSRDYIRGGLREIDGYKVANVRQKKRKRVKSSSRTNSISRPFHSTRLNELVFVLATMQRITKATVARIICMGWASLTAEGTSHLQKLRHKHPIPADRSFDRGDDPNGGFWSMKQRATKRGQKRAIGPEHFFFNNQKVSELYGK